MENKFKIKNQSGIGWIILLYFVMPLFSAILAGYFGLSSPSLSRVPKFYLVKGISLGTSLFWGIFCLGFGSIFILPFLFACPFEDAGMLVFFCIFLLPLPFTGFFLLVHRKKYQKYRALVDSLLVVLDKSNNFTKSDFCFYHCGKQYSYSQIILLMEDLQKSGVLKFKEGGDIVSYSFVGEGSEILEYEYKEWVCRSCGAPNKRRVIVGELPSCEYCNSPCHIVEKTAEEEV